MSIFHVIVAGLVGTTFMSVSMYLIHRVRLANADMIRALGSMVTRSLDNAFPVGLLIHVVAGVLFAIPYTWILNSLPIDAAIADVAAGAAIGVLHGACVSFVLLAVVAEKHPLVLFRTAGVEVAVAHVIGHVCYGAGVGLAWAILT